MVNEYFKFILIYLMMFSLDICAGEQYMYGDIKYKIDISKSFKREEFTEKLEKWRDSLVKNLDYKEKSVVFLPTDIMLYKDDKPFGKLIYQCVEYPELFYLIDSHTFVNFKGRSVNYPAFGGFSLHAPKDRSIIVGLKYGYGGIPFMNVHFDSNKVEWIGTDKYPRNLTGW
jgi:hypothetical protein